MEHYIREWTADAGAKIMRWSPLLVLEIIMKLMSDWKKEPTTQTKSTVYLYYWWVPEKLHMNGFLNLTHIYQLFYVYFECVIAEQWLLTFTFFFLLSLTVCQITNATSKYKGTLLFSMHISSCIRIIPEILSNPLCIHMGAASVAEIGAHEPKALHS